MSDKKEKEEEKEQKSLLGDFFKSIGAGIAKSALLATLVGILIVVGYFLTNPAISGARLTAFVVITLILVAGLLGFLFKRGTGEQREQIRQMSQATVNMNPNTVELAGQLTEEAKQGIRRILQGAAEETADLLGVPKGWYGPTCSGLMATETCGFYRGSPIT